MAYETRDRERAGTRPAPDAAPLETRRRWYDTGGGSLWWVLLAVLTLAFVGWLIWAAVSEDESAGPEVGVTISEIANDPQQFIGRQVTVSGEISAAFGTDAFFIGGDDFVGGDSLLVVGGDLQQLAGGEFAEDDVVQVTGTVRDLDATQLEEEFGIDAGLFDAGFEGPAIVAEQIALTPRAG